MYKKLYFLFVILFFVHVSQGQTSIKLDSCTYDFGGHEYKTNNGISLDKKWKFKAGDDTTWRNSGFNDSNWAELSTDLEKIRDIEKIKQLGFRHTGWFRANINIDSVVANKPIAIKIDNNGAMKVFWDGNPIATYGEFSAQYENQFVPIVFNPGAAGKHLLAIKYENRNFQKETLNDFKGFLVTLINPNNFFEFEMETKLSATMFLVAIGFTFITLFIVHLLLFLFYRKERSNLYFSLFSLSVGVVLIDCNLMYQLVTNLTIINYLQYVLFLSIFGSLFFLSTSINQLFGKFGIAYKFSLLLVLLAVIAVIFKIKNDFWSLLIFVAFLFIFLETIFLILKAIFNKVPGSKIIGVGILFFVFSIIILMLIGITTGGINFSSPNLFIQIMFIGFGILLIFSIPLSISAYLAWNFSQTNKNLEKQIVTVENLAQEKQHILQIQNEVLEHQVEERTKEIVAEKKKSDDLLLNILLSEIAEELKLNGKSEAQKYDEVSVLFTDFVNFTQTSEKLGVQQLLDELNIYFTAFDNIMVRHGLEKIKTIGDAYLSVCGLPTANARHAQQTVLAALDILAFVEKRKSETPYALEIRIGINSGPLIAGIVGIKKFAYDIWGDTVNTAARMEQSGEAGKINVSENTFQLIKEEFACQYRGKISAKGKGEMDMYFVGNIK